MRFTAAVLLMAPLFAQSTVLKCGRLPDTRAGTLVENALVVVRDGVVTEAGVDSVEHASLIDEEGIRMAKAKGTSLVFDIYNADYTLAQGATNGLLPGILQNPLEDIRTPESVKFVMEGGQIPRVLPIGDSVLNCELTS